jgi:hypothetical protein
MHGDEDGRGGVVKTRKVISPTGGDSAVPVAVFLLRILQ